MKNVILIFMVLIFVSCSKQVEVVDLTKSNSKNPRMFFPENVDNFGQLTSIIDSVACANFLNPVLRISLKNDQFLSVESNEGYLLIRPGNICKDYIACFFGNPMLFSNEIKKGVSDWRDDNLTAQVEEYIFNPSERSDLAKRPDRTFFLFQFERSIPIEKVLKIVKKVSLAFYEVQKKYPKTELKFLPIFELPFIPPPPPPNFENS